jgi:prepilin-type processing-associated H-X9-DG protein
MKTKSMREGSGFSLTELLVVVAVIVGIIGTLFPALAGAREASQKTACSSNLRQVVVAWLLYAGDHNDRCVPSYYSLDKGRTVAAWDFTVRRQETTLAEPGLLGPYTRNTGIQQCPTFHGESWGRPMTGYAYNTTYLGGDPAMGSMPVALGQIGDPSGTVAFSDAGFGAPVRAHNFLRAPSDPLFIAGKVHFRHQGTANVVWVDGRSQAARTVHWPVADEPGVGSLSVDDSAYDLD